MRYCHFGVATVNFSASERGLEIDLNTKDLFFPLVFNSAQSVPVHGIAGLWYENNK